MAWITPKTNWVSTDWFNASDYNRIRGNILFLSDLCSQLFATKFSTSIGSAKSVTDRIYADEFNSLEVRLREINAYSVHVKEYDTAKIFYDNGKGIDSDELNRIESVALGLYTALNFVSGGRKRLRFRLLYHSYDNF